MGGGLTEKLCGVKICQQVYWSEKDYGDKMSQNYVV